MNKNLANLALWCGSVGGITFPLSHFRRPTVPKSPVFLTRLTADYARVFMHSLAGLWLLTALIIVCLGTCPQSRAQRASQKSSAPDLSANHVAPQEKAKATEPEPGNILPANHDAAFDAAIARRKALLDRITPVTDAVLQHAPDEDWLTWRRTYSSTGYSPLRQIDTTNVSNLREAWAWLLPASRNEITPLVHDGIIFIKSANTVQALNGKTGDLLWQYVRHLPASFHDGSSAVVKNLAIYQDMIYAPTADGHMVNRKSVV